MNHLRSATAILIVLAPFVLAGIGEAATYEWTDDSGVVHFTDEKEKIPAKFLKRVKELNIGSDQNVISPAAPATENTPPVASPPEKKAFLPGGQGEGYWRSKFAVLRREIKELEESLPAMKEQKVALNRKRVLYGRTSDRVARENMVQSIANVEEKIKVLQDQLKTLDNEASQAGVPLGWRQ